MNMEELLKILACPKCHSDLEVSRMPDGREGFLCSACSVVYPVRDEIPIMLIEEAIPFKQWQEEPGCEC